MSMLLRQFLLNWKLFLREKSAVFWTLVFPVLMLVAFVPQLSLWLPSLLK